MSDEVEWRANALRSMLVRRAALYRQIRQFFDRKEVLEVETPLLCDATALEPNLTSFLVADAQRYLQTSPEFAMKRLLASGSGPIYQLCKAFRQGEEGRRHNPEFSMLEWYQPGYCLDELIAEVEELVGEVMGERPLDVVSYAQVFQRYLDVNPFSAEYEHLQQLARERCGYQDDGKNRDDLLDVLMSQLIEPQLGDGCFTFVKDFPASAAALARIGRNPDGHAIAQRFELYVNGVELANGYDELLDAEEFANRCAANQHQRGQRNLPVYPSPTRLLRATSSIPACCGVALGVDRLLMLAVGQDNIADTLAFPFSTA